MATASDGESDDDDIYADLYIVGEDEYAIAGITHAQSENNNNMDTISRKTTTQIGFRH